ncbi:hypothetical protein [Frankia sp. QA3]|uniref:hypothetical protein n=1 Tax=Frankia sp. QA3 TaxID=710111 RepID=UPI000269BD02|nr:hypothetical protein [Frankia sp. QA3]EIV92951.1 hypothetical protein FraQA3DRAFT_2624 [Frankia sp. QA3]
MSTRLRIGVMNPDRAATYLMVDDSALEDDPVKIARRLHDAIPVAGRVRLFYPGGSVDTANGGSRSPADLLADVVARLPARRTRGTADEVPPAG